MCCTEAVVVGKEGIGSGGGATSGETVVEGEVIVGTGTEVTGIEVVTGTEGAAGQVSIGSTGREEEEGVGEERRVASKLESTDIGEKIGDRPRFSRRRVSSRETASAASAPVSGTSQMEFRLQ